MNIDLCKIIVLPIITEPRGNLTFVESGHQIPFDIQSVYYLFNVPVGGSERGGPAHKELHKLIIAMSGSFDALLDDGKEKMRTFKSLLTRTSRNQEGNVFWGKKRFSAVRGNLDDPPIHVPQNVPALTGLNEITFVGSIPYSVVIVTQKNSICIKILSKNVKTWLIRD